MRKRGRVLRVRTETIDGRPCSRIGRSPNHPEDTIKVLLVDDSEPDRGCVLTMTVSEARVLAVQLAGMSRTR